MVKSSAEQKPIEPIFGPRIPQYSTQVSDASLSWQESALCAHTNPEAFFPEKGGSIREAKLVCQQCPVKAACLEYALAHNERFGLWGGLSERERRGLTNRRAEKSQRSLKNWGLFYLKYLFILRTKRTEGVVRNIPFDASDYAYRSDYRIASINESLLIAIDNSTDLKSYPALSNRLSVLIEIDSLTKKNKLQKVPVFPDWENGVLAYIQDRCRKQLVNPRDLQIFAEEQFGLSVTLHPAKKEYEYAFVANIKPGNISKGFALVDSSQDSDLAISKSILRALASFLLSEVPVSIGQYYRQLSSFEEGIVNFVFDNYVQSIQAKKNEFASKRTLSPFLESAALKALESREIDIHTVATELYEVDDISALENQLQKSGWVK